MNLRKYNTLILVVTALLGLLVGSPALQMFLVHPQTAFFTEMWALDPKHSAENYPVDITLDKEYEFFLGISNHLGRCAYYMVQVKFRNQTQSALDAFARTPSSLSSLYSLAIILADKETWELPVTFLFDYSYEKTNSQIKFNRMMFNGLELNLTGYSTTWDAETNRFYGNLFFELWVYKDTVGGFTYHERYTALEFNMIV